MNPKISAVVCARNEENFIEDCLWYLKNQTLKPEIIVVDGHSTDKTVKIAKKYADMVVFDNKRGISDARNVGWKTAKGDIIAYCDADCLPPKDWIEKVAKYIDDNFCIFGPQIPYDAGIKRQITYKIWQNLFVKISSSYFNYPIVCGANAAFKKSALKRFPFRLKVIEDFDIGNRMKYYGGVKFVSNLYMFSSSRRFKPSFTLVGIRDYLWNWLKLRMGKKESSDYWR